jgi:hypothetical protein
VSLALAPVFLGHAVALHAGVRRGGAAAVRAALAGRPALALSHDPELGSTLDAPDLPGMTVAHVEEAGAHQIRVWALGSEPGALAAERAMSAASQAGVLVNAS